MGANLALGRKLVLAHARSNGHVEDQGRDAGHLMGHTLVAQVEFLAFAGVLVVEDTVGPWASVNVTRF